MRTSLYFLLTSLLLLLSWACSTENNTPLNRFYHQTTAKYNGHFNAKELLRVSLKTYQDSRKEDFYVLLPVYPVPTEKEVKGMLPAIDTAVVKCAKVILNHSMPTAENMFYKTVEYNKWIDENWLTVGEAYFYRRDYQKALDNFQFVKRFFEKDVSTYIASLWIARIYIEQRKYADAKLILDALNERAEIQNDKKFTDYIPFLRNKNPEAGPQMSKNLQFEIHRAYADLALRRREYDIAIEGLELAIAKCTNAKEKARLHYILAQVYQLQNKTPDAAFHYGKAFKAAAAPDIAFNARLNRAIVSGDDRLMADLQKMLRDAKNATFKDQIYYAMAIMELTKGNKPLAKSHLTSSAFYSNNNKRQRAQSYEKLGDLSFQEKNFVYAQKYYDSSSRFITDDYPNGEQIKSKATKLADLVKAIEVAQFEDSVQKIAALSEKDREDFLKETIKQIKRDEQRRKELEAAKLLALQQSQPTNNNTNANKFIFNNTKLREEGFNEFRKNWGQRENTDDWRRSERIVLNANIDVKDQDSSQAQASNQTKDSLTVETLLKDIPLTPAALIASQERLLDALYTSGVLYKEILNETELAAAQFLAILDKKLDHPTDLSAAFQLYKIYENGSGADQYRQYILKKYPSSDAAKYFKDPDFYVKQKQSAQKDQQAYLALVEKYDQGYFSQVQSATQQIIDSDPANAYRSEYLLLNALAVGQQATDKQVLVPLLQRIIDEKPKSDQAVRAKEMLDILKKGYSKFDANKPNKETSIFTDIPNVPQFVIVLLDDDEEADDLRTVVANFSTKAFKTAKVKVSVKTTLDEKNFILISEFPTSKIAWDYLNAYKAGAEYLDDYQNNKIFIINQENLKKLIETSKFDEYKGFFIDNY
jgi:tetratricopeptide (TPR) repeat protein